MESDRDHIKEIFSSKLSNFEPDLPDFIWDKINADLSKKSVAENMPIRKQIYKLAIAVASVAAVVIAVLFLLPKQESDTTNPIIAQSKEKDLGPETVKEKSKETNNRTLNLANVENVNSQKKRHITNQVLQAPMASVLISEETDNLDNESVDTIFGIRPSTETEVIVAQVNKETEPLNIEDKIFEEDLSKQIAAFESKGKELDNLLSSTEIPEKKKTSAGRGFQLGLEGGSGFSKSNDTKSQPNTLFQGADGITMRSSKVKLKHNQPIIFGVGISKKITNKISLETGLNYAYVSSKIKSDDDRVLKQKDAQYFHYLGIPLSINYTFSEWKRFRFYSSLGVMFQKDIYGRIRSNLYSDGLYKVDETDKVKISQKHLQFSTSAALGVSYPIYDKLRVYANFGGAYYFDAKNAYETIYSDKKWMFNLNLGVKFDF